VSAPVYIPVPVETRRDCIVQNGRTYCEKVDMTNSELGWMLLITLGGLAWFMWAMWAIWAWTDSDDRRPALGLGAVILLGCLWLMLQ
jgi:hypothetical protein